ncbi:hypothetical protein UFOVP1492_9 [uncultured Caudovirales phage]|uniref:Uncharacterized protein n=1 Tax=uncultured Caudovirales phage TaxID=2100421 RepID=A0A6J5QT32_9CAUD|nr:hypothetical protein UFOVP1127_125 [uncultured Caudovirales phage]CAB4193468.1 hypothetical protein UFOVP1242_85 [uncultured Caudovirales phage]CAB4217088.1 hypothetical protein UFOVP1492_9 [uncultured Caudovirales phage]CAB5231220.1 hypothetical protein UFOVP1580_38 [uncultured Caudovirales phage]
MRLEEQKRLEKFHDNGYLILIEGSGYVDGPVDSIYTYEEEDSETKGQLVYDSEVFSGQPLSQIQLSNVKVYQPVSFEHTKIEYVEGADEAEEEEANAKHDTLLAWIYWFNLAQGFVDFSQTGQPQISKTMGILNGVEG